MNTPEVAEVDSAGHPTIRVLREETDPEKVRTHIEKLRAQEDPAFYRDQRILAKAVAFQIKEGMLPPEVQDEIAQRVWIRLGEETDIQEKWFTLIPGLEPSVLSQIQAQYQAMGIDITELYFQAPRGSTFLGKPRIPPERALQQIRQQGILVADLRSLGVLFPFSLLQTRETYAHPNAYGPEDNRVGLLRLKNNLRETLQSALDFNNRQDIQGYGKLAHEVGHVWSSSLKVWRVLMNQVVRITRLIAPIFFLTKTERRAQTEAALGGTPLGQVISEITADLTRYEVGGRLRRGEYLGSTITRMNEAETAYKRSEKFRDAHDDELRQLEKEITALAAVVPAPIAGGLVRDRIIQRFEYAGKLRRGFTLEVAFEIVAALKHELTEKMGVAPQAFDAELFYERSQLRYFALRQIITEEAIKELDFQSRPQLLLVEHKQAKGKDISEETYYVLPPGDVSLSSTILSVTLQRNKQGVVVGMSCKGIHYSAKEDNAGGAFYMGDDLSDIGRLIATQLQEHGLVTRETLPPQGEDRNTLTKATRDAFAIMS